MIRSTSIHSHNHFVLIGQKGHITEVILDYLSRNKKATRRMISEDTGISTSTVSGIIKPLLDRGDVIEGEISPCPITGRKSRWVYAR